MQVSIWVKFKMKMIIYKYMTSNILWCEVIFIQYELCVKVECYTREILGR
jgi:hypothetical protein